MGYGFLRVDRIARGVIPFAPITLEDDDPEIEEDTDAIAAPEPVAAPQDAAEGLPALEPSAAVGEPLEATTPEQNDVMWTYVEMVQAEAILKGQDPFAEWKERERQERLGNPVSEDATAKAESNGVVLVAAPEQEKGDENLTPSPEPFSQSGVGFAEALEEAKKTAIGKTDLVVPQPCVDPFAPIPPGHDSFPDELQSEYDSGGLPPLNTVAREMLDEMVPGHLDLDGKAFDTAFAKAFPEGSFSLWEEFGRRIGKSAAAEGQYAGVPMPIERYRLHLEKRYPFKRLHGARFLSSVLNLTEKLTPEQEKEEAEESKPLNSWWSESRKKHVFVERDEAGKSYASYDVTAGTPMERFNLAVSTMQAVQVWSIEAEDIAVEKLKQLVTYPQYKDYRLTGMFSELSKKSGVEYVFRKLRPTVAIGRNGYVLSVMCLHPIGFYDSTWAGVMVPTDDIIAHLLYMRADERKYWAKANHHLIHENEAGL